MGIDLRLNFKQPHLSAALFWWLQRFPRREVGLAWGILREISGSVVVAAVAHGVWNGFAYTLFAFGERVGALGVERTWIHGPEVGIVGLALNLVVVIFLWRLRLRSPVA